ncbi:hypothetical protein IJM86_01320 [bacterium]|nr:hypothetical protein [bacterium]
MEREEYEIGEACQNFDNPPLLEEHSSNETSNTALSQTSTPTETINPTEQVEHHSSTTTDLSLANISCNANEKYAECVWTAVGDANKIDIYLFNFEKGKEYLIGSPKMKDEYFKYELSDDIQQRLRFIPDDGGVEKVFTFNALKPQEVIKKTEPVDIKTPTGPKETTALIFVLSALGYGIYRKIARRYS